MFSFILIIWKFFSESYCWRYNRDFSVSENRFEKFQFFFRPQGLPPHTCFLNWGEGAWTFVTHDSNVITPTRHLKFWINQGHIELFISDIVLTTRLLYLASHLNKNCSILMFYSLKKVCWTIRRQYFLFEKDTYVAWVIWNFLPNIDKIWETNFWINLKLGGQFLKLMSL